MPQYLLMKLLKLNNRFNPDNTTLGYPVLWVTTQCYTNCTNNISFFFLPTAAVEGTTSRCTPKVAPTVPGHPASTSTPPGPGSSAAAGRTLHQLFTPTGHSWCWSFIVLRGPAMLLDSLGLTDLLIDVSFYMFY